MHLAIGTLLSRNRTADALAIEVERDVAAARHLYRGVKASHVLEELDGSGIGGLEGADKICRQYNAAVTAAHLCNLIGLRIEGNGIAAAALCDRVIGAVAHVLGWVLAIAAAGDGEHGLVRRVAIGGTILQFFHTAGVSTGSEIGFGNAAVNVGVVLDYRYSIAALGGRSVAKGFMDLIG